MTNTTSCSCCQKPLIEMTFKPEQVSFDGEFFSVFIDQDEADGIRMELREFCLFTDRVYDEECEEVEV